MSLKTRLGKPTETSVTVLAVSTETGDITINCNGQEITQTPTGYPSGTPVCYHTTFTVADLSSLTKYDYSVTQGVEAVNETLTTAPGEDDDFAIYYTSCDNNTNHGGGVTGYWKYMKEYAENGELPLVGVIFQDDLGYVDGVDVDDTEADGTGLTMVDNPPAVYPVDETHYAIGYMCNMGLLTGTEEFPGKPSSLKQKAWGRDPYRQWCQQNLSVFPQWGDHEFINDIGWDFPTASTVELSAGVQDTPANIFAAGKAAYNVFWGSVQPTVFNASNSNAWGFNLGCCYIVTIDRITNAVGTTGSTSGLFNSSLTPLATHLGSAQINDELNGLNNDKAFKLFGMSIGVRYLFNAQLVTKFESGAQHTLHDHTLAEYQQLFTATGNTPPSIMDNPKTNGLAGTLFTLHGDYHRAKVEHHQKPAYTGNAAENFYSFTMGTNNGSINFGIENSLSDTSVYDGWAAQTGLPAAGADAGVTTLEYLGRNYYTGHHKFFGTPYVPYSDFWGLRIEVYGSRYPKELYVTLLGPARLTDSNTGLDTSDDLQENYGQDGTHNKVLWRKKFVQSRGGNYSHEVDTDIGSKATGVTTGSSE